MLVNMCHLSDMYSPIFVEIRLWDSQEWLKYIVEDHI